MLPTSPFPLRATQIISQLIEKAPLSQSWEPLREHCPLYIRPPKWILHALLSGFVICKFGSQAWFYNHGKNELAAVSEPRVHLQTNLFLPFTTAAQYKQWMLIKQMTLDFLIKCCVSDVLTSSFCLWWVCQVCLQHSSTVTSHLLLQKAPHDNKKLSLNTNRRK